MAHTDEPSDRRPGVARRSLLQAAGAAALVLSPAGAATAATRPSRRDPVPDGAFALGVASGDPLADRVVIWTRLAPDPLRLDGTGGMPPAAVPVRWEVAEDERFGRTVRRGVALARAEDAHSVHVDVAGLRPGRVYFYRFRAGDQVSPTGRTRTAPAPGTLPASWSVAIASCQRFTDGYYTAYEAMLRDEPDLVLHLGDYFYEKDNGPGPVGRQHLPLGECFSLADYRVRIAQVRTDPHLRAIHAAAPFAVTFDDHEVSGNYAGDIPETGAGAGASPEEFRARKALAYKSYWEHMPLRAAQRPRGPEILMYRRLRWGRLATVNLLDTRQYRSDQVADVESPEAYDPERTMLGSAQERWLVGDLLTSRTRWNVLAQQVPFFETPRVGTPGDKWDGYRAARGRLLAAMARRPHAGHVVLSGDIHSNRAADLKADFDAPSSPTVGVEFTGTSITSSGGVVGDEPVTAVYDPDPAVPHMRFRGTGRGYVTFAVTPESWRADYRIVGTVLRPTSSASTVATLTTSHERPGLRHG